MRFITLTFFTFHFAVGGLLLPLNAQWVTQNSGTSTHLVEVRFINQNTGWVSGINGLILKTTNGGINWYQQYTGIYDKVLHRIRAVDTNVVYCVGGFETFLKTTNGGTNWQIIKNGLLGEGHSYYALYFINQNTGWYCGTGQLVFKTTNGGLTIDSFYVPGSYLYDLYFKNNADGITCGETASMYKTTNGGVNWYQVVVPVGSQSADFLQLAFIGDYGWVVGRQNNKVYKTANFGANWDSVVRIVQDPQIYSYSIFFSSINTGWVASSHFVIGDAGRIYKTTNGGYNWHEQVADNYYPNSSIFFITDSIGWCVGNFGKILHTTTGGQFVGVSNTENEIPLNFELCQNYPNPFNSKTKIKYQIAKKSNVLIIIYNSLGQEIETLVNEDQRVGFYEIVWNAANYPSGLYFYKLIIADFADTKKMILVK